MLVLLTLLTLILAFFATKLEIDASAETLLLENDKDLQLTREVSNRYGGADYLVLTYSPKSDLLSQDSLSTLAQLSTQIEQLKMVTSITSILNVPLLQSPPKPVKELLANIPTLTSPQTNKVLAKQEFLNSPLYSNNLVSQDFKTTALLINLKDDKKYRQMIQLRQELRAQNNAQALAILQKELKIHRDIARETMHQNILDIRSILQKYQKDAQLHLGGVSMIADDITTYVQNDLNTFGLVVFILLIAVLAIIFRDPKWVFIPILICIYSVLSTTGLLGLLGWEITVVSSNFISLQLIMNMSLVIHLVIKYKEFLEHNPTHSQQQLIYDTVRSMAKPSFFVVITTITGFSSLVLSNILPIMNFGWMMSMAITLSLVYTFLLFPSILMLLKKKKVTHNTRKNIAFTKHLGNYAQSHKTLIMLGMLIALTFTFTGAQRLFVENSFIDYFKQNTEIYKGMKIIDQQLGGTTPLDVVITFKQDETINSITIEDTASSEDDDMMDEFEDEFAADASEEQYWFTQAKMQRVKQIHDYLDSLPQVGKVLSLATMGEVGKSLNDGKELDSLALALLYQKLPSEYRSIILDPYMNIKNNQIRITMRIIDSQKDLRRDALIKKIHKDLTSMLNPKYEQYGVSGIMVLYNNMLQSLFDSQIKTLGVVIIILFIMFLILFRSLKVALIAITANLVPVGVIFGFMGWFKIPLDMMTITIAAISIGIAVDDTIHYIHRFTLEYEKTKNYLQSMRNAHQGIGTAMFYTSLIIMIGFSVLIISAFIPTIYFGILTIIAMFMAIVADLLLLPVLLLIFKPFKN
ncbi:MAG: MMPL family transporter [Campylobacterota bacterium]|nr:MMPL family transporter [Campylobacterota bacterium]